MADLRLLIAGAGGRMGRTLLRAALESPGIKLTGAVERAGASALGEDVGVLAGRGPAGVRVSETAAPLLGATDAIVDFTNPTSSLEFAALAAKAKVAHVLGTTGFTAADEEKVAAAARETVIVKSGNMSLGVNLLAALTRQVAKTLGEEFDIEILEMHHRAKIDAPSGTALMFGQAAAAGRGVDLDKRRTAPRDGLTGARKPGDIGFAALRGGSVVGEHSVIFAGPAERLELVHKAEDRMIFARGALTAARWAKGKKPGLYSMADVLGLTDF
jgi:4-hydroxy-tetrahydrodipicolinate reductase